MSIKRVFVRAVLAAPVLLPVMVGPASADPTSKMTDGIIVEAGLGYERQQLPGFGYGKNYGGTHLANNDDNADGLRWGVGAGYALGGDGWLGSNQRIVMRYSHLAADSNRTDAPAAPAFSFDPLVGIVSFDGTSEDHYGTQPYVPGEETIVVAKMDYKNDEISASFEADRVIGVDTTLITALAIVIGQTKSDYSTGIDGISAFGLLAHETSFADARLERKYAGPEITLGLQHNLGSGFALAGGMRLGVLAERTNLSADDCADRTGGDGVCDGLNYRTSVSQTNSDIAVRGSLNAGMSYSVGTATLGVDGYAGLDRARMKIVTPNAVGAAAVHVDKQTLSTVGGQLYFQIKF